VPKLPNNGLWGAAFFSAEKSPQLKVNLAVSLYGVIPPGGDILLTDERYYYAMFF